jgi:Ca2+-binding EF-hand superfamily protein
MNKLTAILATLVATLSIIGMPASAQAGDGEKKAKAKEKFEELDRNGDGLISRREYVAGRQGVQAVKAAKRFKAMDVDGDGSVSPSEFKAYAKERAQEKGE